MSSTTTSSDKDSAKNDKWVKGKLEIKVDDC